ncbi:choice-of-anchor J domain-containing protein [uncultured Muribaculum sp.]|uniref:choice-of-anchor J domain-containing protein n=1 Tax=uncultured Muribaculum sp. TaxID=1918613 RepID=UPI0025D9714C|nr:choice-of-anchor J domain-containing protein [uncultured Muribaculum sp.]
MKSIFTKPLAAACLVAATTVTVQAGETAYGYLFGSKSGKYGFVSFDIDKPQTLNNKNTNYGYVHPSAGEYVDGKVYTYQVELGDISEIYPDSWAVYDGETFKQLQKKSKTTMNRVVDMTYDYTTNTMYALIEDKYTTGELSPTSLCAVDMATGDYTLLGSPGELTAIDGYGREDTDALITLACDAAGQLYAMSSYRYLYKIDKFTAKVEQAAPRHNLGTASQFQSMTFAADGKLWWAQQHPSYGHFCEIDLTTGIPGGFVDFKTDYEKLNKLGDDSQVTALFLKDKTIRSQSLKTVTDLKAEVSDVDVNTVRLTWTLPTQDYSGAQVVPTGVTIYRIGTSEPIATLDGNAVTFTDTSAPNGDVVYEVLPSNEAGYGFPAFTSVFSGYDRLTAVTDIAVEVTDRTVTATWKAPTTTVNGGYADYNAITYNVYRGIADALTEVAKGLTTPEFSETITENGGFYYVIEAVSGGVAGVRATSETFVLSSTATIPYFTGFEDDGDGSQWTFINNPASAGWSIGYRSYLYDGKKTAIGSTNGKPADDWLISPAIEFEAGNHVLGYYANGASYDTHSYEICLGTDPKSVESFTNKIYSIANEKVYDPNGANLSGTESKGWAHIEISFNVPEAGVYHLGIHNVNTCTYANLRIDNLSINKAGSSSIESATNDGNDISLTVLDGTAIVSATTGLSSVSIVNLQGQSAANIDARDATTVEINTASLARGLYIISATTSEGRTVSFKTRL